MLSYLQYSYPWPCLGRFLPAFFWCFGFWFLWLPFYFCFVSLLTSQKLIWSVIKITFVFKCFWGVLSPKLPVSLCILLCTALLSIYKAFHSLVCMITKTCYVLFAVILLLSLIFTEPSFLLQFVLELLVFLTISKFLEFLVQNFWNYK